MTFLRLLSMASVLVILSGTSCKKKDTTPYGSPYTKDMCGTRSYLKIESGYRYFTHERYNDSSYVDISIIFIDASMVTTSSGGTYKYNTGKSNDSELVYVYTKLDNHIMEYEISFNRYTNRISIYESNYISAGGGTVTTNWISL